jgi:hypothetical protein
MRREILLAGLLALVTAGSAGAQVIILDNFEGSLGRFTNDPDFSGSTAGQTQTTPGVGPSNHALDTTTAAVGNSSLRVFMDDNPTVDAPDGTAWRLRLLSGGGTPANNQSLVNNSTAHVGYWLRTTTPNLRAAILLDDGAALERSARIPIIPDGQWRLYQWTLSDAAQWDAFAGTAPNGQIDEANVTIDGIWVDAVKTTGDQDATFFIDAVSYHAAAPIPEPGALVLAALGAAAVLWRRRA